MNANRGRIWEEDSLPGERVGQSSEPSDKWGALARAATRPPCGERGRRSLGKVRPSGPARAQVNAGVACFGVAAFLYFSRFL